MTMQSGGRIAQRFAQLKQQNRKALIPYITGGDSNPSITVPLMHRLVESGADMIELGVPFSDPMADGPTIQLACERALKHHTSLHDVLDMAAEFRKSNSDTPLILMGYLNPIEAIGYENFIKDATTAGIDGAIIVDLPPEEGHDLLELMQNSAIDPIFLLSPTTSDERVELIADAASGFLYYVSLKGVTGSSALNVDEVAERISFIKSKTDLPVCVGFGIKDAQSAKAVSSVSDGVIVGSALVKIIEQHPDNSDTILNRIGELVAAMRQAMDAA